MTKLKKYTDFFIMAIFCILAFLVFTKSSQYSQDKKVIITFLINGIIWIKLAYAEIKRRAYSMNSMHWIFSVFFFCFAPVVQYAYGKFPWIWDRSDNILIRANILLLIWTSVVLLGNKSAHVNNKRKHMLIKQTIVTNRSLPILTIINIVNVLIRIKSIGLENIFARSTNTGVSFSSYGSLSMMISGVLQAIAYFATVLSILQFKRKNFYIIY